MVSRFYITTPIYYATAEPHVGSAYTTVNADALARWHRLIGDETFFLTGTDEHGQKVADAAEKEGLTPRALTDLTSAKYRQSWANLNISNDDFLRTSEPRHYASVQKFLTAIYDNGYIYKDVYEGLYCVSCEDYYTPDALIDGLCPVHARPVITMQEDNWFFALSKFQDRLAAYYEQHPTFTTPATKFNEAIAFVRGGLNDISISRRSLTWGVPVPWDEGQVFYVWCDALVNYFTALGYGSSDDRVEHWWPHVHHVIGKEISRFHCVWWPAMCMAAGFEPPAHVHVHGWLLTGGKKLGKTMSPESALSVTDIAPSKLTQEYGVDAIRYYLLRETALGLDGEFSLEGITARYNTDLANNLGNLVSRVAAVVSSKCGGIGPAPTASSALGDVARDFVDSAFDAWQSFQPSYALEAVWRLIGAANADLETNEPWKMTPGHEVDAVMGNALEAIRLVAVLISPALPDTASEIWRRIGLDGSPGDAQFEKSREWGGYPGGLKVEKGDPLFPRLSVDP